MSIFLLVFLFTCNQVFGQYKNGVIFNDVREETVNYYRQGYHPSAPRE